MSISVGDLFLDLNINPKNINKQINNAASQSQNIAQKSFGNIGRTIASALSVAAVVSFGKSCLDLGSDLAEVQNVVDVTFPNMNAQVNNFAKNAINQFGLSETVAKRMIGTYGAMSKAFGFSEKSAYDMATTLTGLAGDVASFYNLDPTEAYTKLKSVFSGETETLKDLGIVMTQNALDQYALANGYGKTTSAMSEQEKVSLRLAFVTQQLSAAGGDFARTSDSWANKTRVLSLNFQSLKATIGQGLINVLSPIISVLNMVIVKLQTAANWFVKFTSLLSNNKKTSSTLGSVSSVLSDSSNGAKSLANNISGVGDSAKKAAKKMGALAGFDELNVIKSSDSSDSSTNTGDGSSTGSLGGLDMGSGMDIVPEIDTSKMEKSIKKMKSTWDGFTNFLNKKKAVIISLSAGIVAGFAAFETIKNWTNITGCISSVTTYLSNLFKVISVGSQGLNALLINFTGLTLTGGLLVVGIAAVTAALVYLYQTSEGFRKLINDAIANISSILNNMYTSILKPLFSFIVDFFKTVLIPLATFISTIFVKAVEAIGTVILSYWNNILFPLYNFLIDCFGIALQGIISIWNGWKPAIQGVFSALNWLWKNLLSPLVDFIVFRFTTSFESWGKSLSNIIANAKGMFQGLVDFITGVFTLNWRKAWNGVQNIFYNIISGLANIFKSPINYIIDGINSFISGLNKIKIPDWVPVVGGKGFKIGKIPRLANGGYVKANSPQLTMIGDNKTQGEIVSPEGKMYDIMISALKSYGQQNANKEDIKVLVNILLEILEAIKNLRLVIDGDSLNNDINKRDVERGLRTGNLITV